MSKVYLEALETLKDMIIGNGVNDNTNDYVDNLILPIKQALLKIQKEHKALEIIKKKCLTNCNLALVEDNLYYQNYCKEFEYFLNKYNENPNGFEITKEDLLTEEEFNLLKEVLE